MTSDKTTEDHRQIVDRSELTGGHQRHPVSLKQILAPTDLTADAEKAVDYAVNLARGFWSETDSASRV